MDGHNLKVPQVLEIILGLQQEDAGVMRVDEFLLPLTK